MLLVSLQLGEQALPDIVAARLVRAFVFDRDMDTTSDRFVDMTRLVCGLVRSVLIAANASGRTSH